MLTEYLLGEQHNENDPFASVKNFIRAFLSVVCSFGSFVENVRIDTILDSDCIEEVLASRVEGHEWVPVGLSLQVVIDHLKDVEVEQDHTF